jgi:hypothetical protein
LNRIDLVLKRSQLSVPVIQSQSVSYQGSLWQGWTGEVWNYGYEMAEEFDPSKPDSNPIQPFKKPEKRKKPAIKDTLSFIQPVDFLKRQGMGADVNDPHLLRPDEERLAAWISEQLSTDVMAAYDEDPMDEESKAELIERNGFVLDLTGVSTVDAIGFLQRRVAEQSVPVKTIVKPATETPATVTPPTTKPAEAKPDAPTAKLTNVSQPKPKASAKPVTKPVSKPKPAPATKKGKK